MYSLQAQECWIGNATVLMGRATRASPRGFDCHDLSQQTPNQPLRTIVYEPQKMGTYAEKAREIDRAGADAGAKLSNKDAVVVLLTGLIVSAAVVCVPYRTASTASQSSAAARQIQIAVDRRSPKCLAELLALSRTELARCDIGLMNLLCSEGLRGAENKEIHDQISRLDGIAKHVGIETERHLYRFRKSPFAFNNSEGYFRMLMMAVILQEDLGVGYNPDRITPVGEFEPNDVFFAEARDIFIHGLIGDDRRMGTCSSLPVLYVAVGRRLGYPLSLVPTQNHLFVRWEDRRERFNVDATGRGMNMYDDNHYRQWPIPISLEDEREFGYLKSMTATDELSAFLSLRGHCLLAMGKIKEGVEAHEMALRVSSNSRLQQLITAKAREQLQPQPLPIAFLPPEQRDPFWPRTTSGVWRASGLPGFKPGVPRDPNPLNAIPNQ